MKVVWEVDPFISKKSVEETMQVSPEEMEAAYKELEGEDENT